jgi:hypothetical protein
VIQTLSNGHLKAFTADKGDLLLDVELPLRAGVGPPMTYMLDGKQYIAVMAGTGAVGRGRGRGGPAEPTAAAAQAPTAPVANVNPKLLVYAVPN